MRSLPASFRPSKQEQAREKVGVVPFSPLVETENEEHFSLGYMNDESSIGAGGGRSRSVSLVDLEDGTGGKGGRDDSGFADGSFVGEGGGERDPLGVGVGREKG